MQPQLSGTSAPEMIELVGRARDIRIPSGPKDFKRLPTVTKTLKVCRYI